MIIKEGLIKLIKHQYKLDIDSIHGIKHWNNVDKIGKYLTKHTKADLDVIWLFSFFHDSKRENEADDKKHGLRASYFIKEMYNNKLLTAISQIQLDQLCFVCKHHTNSNIKSSDITIQSCWDADRLDLWRVGIFPDKNFLNTDIAKQEKTLEFSASLNI